MVVLRGEQREQSGHLASRLDLRRHATGIGQDPVGAAQLFGHQQAVSDDERTAGAWKIVEHARGYRVLDARLRQKVEQEQATHRGPRKAPE